jgi:iron-sulfur cluster repair protein YtfE (RIC family)
MRSGSAGGRREGFRIGSKLAGWVPSQEAGVAQGEPRVDPAMLARKACGGRGPSASEPRETQRKFDWIEACFSAVEERSMSSSQPLPSMFGRFTAILQDHEHLAKTLRALRLMCQVLERGDHMPTDLAPDRLLSELHSDLVDHFAAEESEEYFGTVMRDMPALVPQIGGLKWEHMTMLQAVGSLHSASRDRSRWNELPQPTREVIELLEQHERAESHLLRQYFNSR